MTDEGFVGGDELTRVRREDPARIRRLLDARVRREITDVDGGLLIIAADHPARGALGAGGDPMAMADRRQMLERMRTALAVPGVHGVLGTPDVLEDLLLMGALEDRIVFGSMNRGGLHGSSWELEDRFTAYDAAAIQHAGFTGGKMLTRIDLADERSSRTMEWTARAIDELAARDLIAMVEPFWSTRQGGALRNDLDPESVIRAIHVAQGLGRTSAHTWLKLPAVAEIERVMAATTLPTLILGGDPRGGDVEAVYASWRHALAQPPVQGLVIGRSLLYPQDDDVETAVRTAVEMLR